MIIVVLVATMWRFESDSIGHELFAAHLEHAHFQRYGRHFLREVIREGQNGKNVFVGWLQQHEPVLRGELVRA